jgi:Domain of unknown function (DUF4350)
VKQNVFIFGGLILLVLAFVGLNAASFSRQNIVPDSEFRPNRSSYNTDATGTRAVYDLLAETGRKVMRWQEKPSALLANDKNRPSVFVIIGQTRREVSDDDAMQIMRWVSEGGRLVVIDRSPMAELIKTTADWQINVKESEKGEFNVDPNVAAQMTDKVVASKSMQPTVYTKSVNAILPSIFASTIDIQPLTDSKPKPKIEGFKIGDLDEDLKNPPPVKKSFETPMPTPKPIKNEQVDKIGASDEPPTRATKTPISQEDEDYDEPPPQKVPTPAMKIDDSESGIGMGDGPASEAAAPSNFTTPFVHFANGKEVLLADFPFGEGEVVVLSDPFIVANNGITLADNAQLAINLLGTTTGLTAFDEYHQGYGTNDNRLFAYFENTPVIAIFGQIGLLALLFFWSSGRRFARPLPFENPNRLSKLEYVGAMAEIQENTRAYDLAIESIFAEFRRKLIRFAATDNTITNESLAEIISNRSKINANSLAKLMNDCVAIRQGEPTNKREVFSLVKQMREIESELGIKRAAKRSK